MSNYANITINGASIYFSRSTPNFPVAEIKISEYAMCIFSTTSRNIYYSSRGLYETS